ncbi:hypothetical protein GVAV_000310 [Gurleya vavrai]
MEKNVFESYAKKVEFESIEKIIYEAIKNNMNENNEILFEELLLICKNYGKESIETVLNSYMDAGALIFDSYKVTLTI